MAASGLRRPPRRQTAQPPRRGQKFTAPPSAPQRRRAGLCIARAPSTPLCSARRPLQILCSSPPSLLACRQPFPLARQLLQRALSRRASHPTLPWEQGRDPGHLLSLPRPSPCSSQGPPFPAPAAMRRQLSNRQPKQVPSGPASRPQVSPQPLRQMRLRRRGSALLHQPQRSRSSRQVRSASGRQSLQTGRASGSFTGFKPGPQPERTPQQEQAAAQGEPVFMFGDQRPQHRGHRRPLRAALPRRCPAQAAPAPGGSPWAARTVRLPRAGASRSA